MANYTGQLHALRNRVKAGDFVVLPLKTTKQVAIGVVTSGYRYVAENLDTLRHLVTVDWKQTDVPRTAVKQDLLYSLGSALSFCEITRNDALDRVRVISDRGIDPGLGPSTAKALIEASDSEESGTNLDLEQIGRDQIRCRIVEEFDGFGLGLLVGKVLDARGSKFEYSPQGGDGGVDLLAGSGILGLDSPRIVVQVKSESTSVNATVTRGLQGVMSSYNADQALLVAWGGVNSTARAELKNQFFQVRVWDAEAFIDELLAVYGELDDELRNELRLKPIWIVDQTE